MAPKKSRRPKKAGLSASPVWLAFGKRISTPYIFQTRLVRGMLDLGSFGRQAARSKFENQSAKKAFRAARKRY